MFAKVEMKVYAFPYPCNVISTNRLSCHYHEINIYLVCVKLLSVEQQKCKCLLNSDVYIHALAVYTMLCTGGKLICKHLSLAIHLVGMYACGQCI